MREGGFVGLGLGWGSLGLGLGVFGGWGLECGSVVVLVYVLDD